LLVSNISESSTETRENDNSSEEETANEDSEPELDVELPPQWRIHRLHADGEETISIFSSRV
jgi:uncharacterized protein YjaG (DUF416 family)